MDFNQYKDAIIVGLCGLAVTMGGGFSALFIYEFRRLRASVETLNINFAVIVPKVSDHEGRLTRLEETKVPRKGK